MKKVLILSYYWPPSGGSGVQRWLKFVKYLREFGWEPVVYTAENPEMPARDESLESEIPEGIEVIKRPIWEPYSLFKKLMGMPSDTSISAGFTSEKKKSGIADRAGKWVRGNFFIPDARRFWIRPSTRFLKHWLRENKIDAIVSTGPPHSMHIIAMNVAKSTGIPWLTDFRDPWTDIDFYKDLHLTALADRKHHRLENKVLIGANKVVVVSRDMAKNFAAKPGVVCEVITNGFDDSDHQVNPAINRKNEIVMLHTGTLGPDRNSPAFWEILGEIVSADSHLPDKLKIRLIGSTDISCRESIIKAGLQNNLEQVAYMDHDEIIEEMNAASILMLFINNSPNAKGILTGKVFEYLASGKPVIGTGPIDGDASAILIESGAGSLYDFMDREALRSGLRTLLDEALEGNLKGGDNKSIMQYSRRNLTSQMAKLLTEMTAIS